jgi:hypothetical protein
MALVFAIGYCGIIVEDTLGFNKAGVALLLAVALWTIRASAGDADASEEVRRAPPAAAPAAPPCRAAPAWRQRAQAASRPARRGRARLPPPPRPPQPRAASLREAPPCVSAGGPLPGRGERDHILPAGRHDHRGGGQRARRLRPHHQAGGAARWRLRRCWAGAARALGARQGPRAPSSGLRAGLSQGCPRRGGPCAPARAAASPRPGPPSLSPPCAGPSAAATAPRCCGWWASSPSSCLACSTT